VCKRLRGSGMQTPLIVLSAIGPLIWFKLRGWL